MRRVIAGLLFVLAAPWVLAQGTTNTVELTPTVGYWWGDTLVRGTTGAFDFDVTIDDAPAYGLRLGYKLTPNWAVEGYLARERADLVTGRSDLFGGVSKLGTIDVTTAEVGVEGAFGHSRVVPFLDAGVGAMDLAPNLAGLSSDTRFTAYFGGGFKLFFTPSVALRFDFRGHSVNVGNNRSHCDWWDACDGADDWITFREFGVGLTFVI